MPSDTAFRYVISAPPSLTGELLSPRCTSRRPRSVRSNPLQRASAQLLAAAYSSAASVACEARNLSRDRVASSVAGGVAAVEEPAPLSAASEGLSIVAGGDALCALTLGGSLVSASPTMPSSALAPCAFQPDSHRANKSSNLNAAALMLRPMRMAARFQTARTRRSASRNISTTEAYTAGMLEADHFPSPPAACTHLCRLALQRSSTRDHMAPHWAWTDRWSCRTPWARAVRSTSSKHCLPVLGSSAAMVASAMPQPQTIELALSPAARSVAARASCAAPRTASVHAEVASWMMPGKWCICNLMTATRSARPGPLCRVARARTSSQFAVTSSRADANVRVAAARAASSPPTAASRVSSATVAPWHSICSACR